MHCTLFFLQVSAILNLNAFTLLVKNFFLLKDTTRSRPVRKTTYELDEHLKNNYTTCPKISGLILLVINNQNHLRSLPKTPVNRQLMC